MSKQLIHAGVDIGTTKVSVVVMAQNASTGAVEVIGAGVAECDGLKRGVVSNINKTADAIRAAVDRAEQTSGYKIGPVVIGVSGEHISTFTTRGIVTTRTSEIAEDDVKRLHDELAQVHVTPDRRILHVIPQDYIIDGQDGISDPLGMSGRRLEANALVVTGSASAIDNVYKCAERAGLHVDAVVLQSIASAYAVLDDAEREVGVAIVDIGGGTTDMAIYKDNVLRYVSVIGIAGQRVTDDIVAVLGIRNTDAESIKVSYGHAISESILRDEHFQIPGVGGRTPTELSKSILCQVIEPRMEEIYDFVLAGGCTELYGSELLAQRTFRLPVNKGLPRGYTIDGFAREVTTPSRATAIGLALYSLQHHHEFLSDADDAQQVQQQPVQPPVTQTPEVHVHKKGMGQRLKDWFENF